MNQDSEIRALKREVEDLNQRLRLIERPNRSAFGIDSWLDDLIEGIENRKNENKEFLRRAEEVRLREENEVQD